MFDGKKEAHRLAALIKSVRKGDVILVTDSEQTRKTPDFNTELALSHIRGGLFTILVLAGLFYIMFRVLFRPHPEVIWTLEFWTHWYNWILPVLCIFGMPFVAIVVYLDSVIDAFSVIFGKLKWISNAARAQAIIVDKRTRVDWEYREDYSYQILISELKLKYTPTLASNHSSEQVLWASIQHAKFEKYEIGDTVSVFYSIGDPSLFLIEGE